MTTHEFLDSVHAKRSSRFVYTLPHVFLADLREKANQEEEILGVGANGISLGFDFTDAKLWILAAPVPDKLIKGGLAVVVLP